MSSFQEVLDQVLNQAQQSTKAQSPVGTQVAPTSSARTNELEDQVARLSLGAEAMWRLLSEHLGFTDKHLLDVIDALDTSDGTKDGHFRPAPVNCFCGAAVNASVESCQFCGAEAERRKVF